MRFRRVFWWRFSKKARAAERPVSTNQTVMLHNETRATPFGQFLTCTSAQTQPGPNPNPITPTLTFGLEVGKGGHAAPPLFFVAFHQTESSDRKASLDQSVMLHDFLREVVLRVGPL